MWNRNPTCFHQMVISSKCSSNQIDTLRSRRLCSVSVIHYFILSWFQIQCSSKWHISKVRKEVAVFSFTMADVLRVTANSPKQLIGVAATSAISVERVQSPVKLTVCRAYVSPMHSTHAFPREWRPWNCTITEHTLNEFTRSIQMCFEIMFLWNLQINLIWKMHLPFPFTSRFINENTN